MSDTFGKLPLPAGVRTWDVPHEGCTITYQQTFFTAEQMRAYAAEQVAVDREVDRRGRRRPLMTNETTPAEGRSNDGLCMLDDDEADPVRLWAEIHRLRAAVQGPDGFATWQDAAVAERVRRVRAERAIEFVRSLKPLDNS